MVGRMPIFGSEPFKGEERWRHMEGDVQSRRPVAQAKIIRGKLRPNLPVEGTVLNRLLNMVAQNFFRTGQVGIRSRHLQNPVVGPDAQIQIGHCVLEQFLGRLVEGAEFLEFLRTHQGVAGDFSLVRKTRLLAFPRMDDALADLRGGLARPIPGDFQKLPY